METTYKQHSSIVGEYTVTELDINVKAMKCYSLKIADWANRRLLYVDTENRILYLQASSESNGCHRCEICQKRMRDIGGKDFVTLPNHYSLYARMIVDKRWSGTAGMDLTLLENLKKLLWYVKEWD